MGAGATSTEVDAAAAAGARRLSDHVAAYSPLDGHWVAPDLSFVRRYRSVRPLDVAALDDFVVEAYFAEIVAMGPYEPDGDHGFRIELPHVAMGGLMADEVVFDATGAVERSMVLGVLDD